MEKHLQDEIKEEINEIRKSVTPLLLKIAIIILFTGGLLGSLFFSAVLFFHIDGSNFSNFFGYNDIHNTAFTIFIILELIAHLGFIISSINLYKLKRSGVYLFILFFALFIAGKIFYNALSALPESFLGLIILIFVMISWKKLK